MFPGSRGRAALGHGAAVRHHPGHRHAVLHDEHRGRGGAGRRDACAPSSRRPTRRPGQRIQARRRFMADALGIDLHPDVLPLSNLAGHLPPFLLRPDRAMTARPDEVARLTGRQVAGAVGQHGDVEPAAARGPAHDEGLGERRRLLALAGGRRRRRSPSSPCRGTRRPRLRPSCLPKGTSRRDVARRRSGSGRRRSSRSPCSGSAGPASRPAGRRGRPPSRMVGSARSSASVSSSRFSARVRTISRAPAPVISWFQSRTSCSTVIEGKVAGSTWWGTRPSTSARAVTTPRAGAPAATMAMPSPTTSTQEERRPEQHRAGARPTRRSGARPGGIDQVRSPGGEQPIGDAGGRRT